jgi:predicted nucleic acid-binding protein
MPGDKVFLDTDIILYAYDVSAGEKHQRAKEIVLDLWNSGLAVISTQVLQEFFVTATQKIPKPLDARFAKNIVGDLLKWQVVINDGAAVLDAIELLLQYGYSFWESLIIEASIKGGAEILLSEDLSHGQTIQSVTIMNPFKAIPF